MNNSKHTTPNFLSRRSSRLTLPKSSIVNQFQKAKTAQINATIGVALSDSLEPMYLKSIKENINLSPKEIFPYTTTTGLLALRDTWKSRILAQSNLEISTPIVTNAMTHGLNLAGFLTLDERDTLTIFSPHYPNYDLIFGKYLNVKVNTIPLFKKNNLNLTDFEKFLNKDKEKKVILLNFPNNPTGYNPTKTEIEHLVKIIKNASSKQKITIILDEAYRGFSYSEDAYSKSLFPSLANLSPNLLTILLDGPTKELFSWGLRVGFITFGTKNNTHLYKILEEKSMAFIRATTSTSPTLSQHLILKTLENNQFEKEIEQNFRTLKKRYKKVLTVLDTLDFRTYMNVIPFNSGYFFCIELKTASQAEFIRQQMLKNYNIGIISTGKCIRIAYSSIKEDDIQKVLESILKIYKSKYYSKKS